MPIFLLVLCAAVLEFPVAAQETYAGREIAEVMSYRGAAWLERSERSREEDTEQLMRLLPIERGHVVVDMGCGSGYYARRMSPLVGPTGRVLCVDIQPEMLRIAQKLANDAGLDNIEFILNATDDPKLPSGEVDLILLVDVYHEFADPAPMLRGMREALSREGIAALVEYRLEGESAQWIKREHRMSVDQVKKEWLPAGFELVQLHESLPSQHLFLFSATSHR